MFHTQMQAAKSGVVTDEMRAVAAMEHRDENEIRDLVARGQVVICANKLHTCLKPCGVGSMLSTKINVNFGVSKDCKDYDAECPAMVGTVPIYDSVIHYRRDLDTLTARDFLDVVRLHAADGVDFMTLHCGITRKTVEQIKAHKREMNIVSRGGSLVFAWMSMTGEENPFYEYFDEILDICCEYDVTLSLGDACRPGRLADAGDVCQIEE